MTATIGEQIDRIQHLVQDRDAQAYDRGVVLLQHQEELTRLGRERRFGEILAVNAVAGQARYTLEPHTLAVEMVLYNGQRLEYASEEFLDRYDRTWSYTSGKEPKYWTTSNQDPNTLRIAPAPQRTGANFPPIPPIEISLPVEDNLIVFLFRTFADTADDEQDVFPVLDIWEDVCVWRTAGELARREDPWQNLPLSQVCYGMAELWSEVIER